MSRIEKSYKLRNECLSQERVFTDSFLINLYEYIENNEDREFLEELLL